MTTDNLTDWRAFFSGRYLTGPDCESEPTFTIARVAAENVENPDDQTVRRKMIVHFRGDDAKPWIPCRTTAECLAAMWGNNPQDWSGKPITLYFDKTVRVGREVKGGVRVKGSPLLDKPMHIQVKLPRRRPLKITLEPTGNRGGPRVPVTVSRADALAFLDNALAEHSLTVADLDGYARSAGKPTSDDMAPKVLAAIATGIREGSDKGRGIVASVQAWAAGEEG